MNFFIELLKLVGVFLLWLISLPFLALWLLLIRLGVMGK